MRHPCCKRSQKDPNEEAAQRSVITSSSCGHRKADTSPRHDPPGIISRECTSEQNLSSHEMHCSTGKRGIDQDDQDTAPTRQRRSREGCQESTKGSVGFAQLTDRGENRPRSACGSEKELSLLRSPPGTGARPLRSRPSSKHCFPFSVRRESRCRITTHATHDHAVIQRPIPNVEEEDAPPCALARSAGGRAKVQGEELAWSSAPRRHQKSNTEESSELKPARSRRGPHVQATEDSVVQRPLQGNEGIRDSPSCRVGRGHVAGRARVFERIGSKRRGSRWKPLSSHVDAGR